jgi:hypothetical protein
MSRPAFEVAQIVRDHRGDLEAIQPLSQAQGRALSAIGQCRTATLGGHQNVCLDCGQEEDPSYNSCRNRNCPKCQNLAQQRWINARAKALLLVPHFHGVFTLPAQLRPLARQYPRAIYDAMFQCVAATLLEMGQSRLGATLGLTLVLHTWTRKLTYHVHIHVLITAGGLTPDGTAFKSVPETFLLHVKPLAALFKGKLMAVLRDLRAQGVFAMTDGAFGGLMARLEDLDWHVYLKEAFKSPAWVLEYLGRYTHRVGISNSRLLQVTPDRITFRTKGDSTESVPPAEFLRRFVQHVLPPGFKKIRHAGLYAKPMALAQAKELIGTLPSTAPSKPSEEVGQEPSIQRDDHRCRSCGGPLFPRFIPRPIRSKPSTFPGLVSPASRSPP